MMTMIENEARAALAAKGDAERQLALAAACPPWRHVAFGAVMAVLVALPAVGPTLRIALLGCVVVAILLIVQSDRRRTGMFVNGYRQGKTRAIAFATLAVDLALYLASVFMADDGRVMAILALAAVAFAVSVAGSVWWQRVFVRELGA